jgi:hypothetical protein
LDKEIDNLELLKAHLPYHESDHVLNIAYNVLVGGKRLEDIELVRQAKLGASCRVQVPVGRGIGMISHKG